MNKLVPIVQQGTYTEARPLRSHLTHPDSEETPTPTIDRLIEVRYRHQVHFTHHVFDPANTTLRDVLIGLPQASPRKAMVIIDDSLAAAQPTLCQAVEAYFATYPAQLHLVCPPVVVEGGERVKNSYFHVSEIQSRIDRYHIDRHSYLIAVGGGALLDMAGLAAATAHRGVRHVRIPTTTLAQDDSGVGVKNGINAFGKKNFIGSFAPPHAVINDFQLLASLSHRDLRAGYIEAVKVALIRDAGFFEAIERDAGPLAEFQPAAMQRLIHRCAELHVQHIATSGDPFEFGSARPLDFGHWAAHKLEQLSEYRLRHGEAVAIGIALDTVYSRRIGLLAAADSSRILALIDRLGFELQCQEMHHVGTRGALLLLDGLEEFREHLGGELTITLLEAIGRGVEVHQIQRETMIQALQELSDRRPARVEPGRSVDG